MRALILAAGVGHRPAPLTDQQPKCLLPGGGRSLLERMLEALAGLILYMRAVVVDTATHTLLVLAMGVTASRTGGALARRAIG